MVDAAFVENGAFRLEAVLLVKPAGVDLRMERHLPEAARACAFEHCFEELRADASSPERLQNG